MVIVTHIIFPTENAKEVGKRMLTIGPLPDYLVVRGPYIYSIAGEGIHSIDIFELDKSKMAEALEFLNNRHVAFFGVPGYTFSVHVCMEAAEAIRMVGLA